MDLTAEEEVILQAAQAILDRERIRVGAAALFITLRDSAPEVSVSAHYRHNIVEYRNEHTLVACLRQLDVMENLNA